MRPDMDYTYKIQFNSFGDNQNCTSSNEILTFAYSHRGAVVWGKWNLHAQKTVPSSMKLFHVVHNEHNFSHRWKLHFSSDFFEFWDEKLSWLTSFSLSEACVEWEGKWGKNEANEQQEEKPRNTHSKRPKSGIANDYAKEDENELPTRESFGNICRSTKSKLVVKILLRW